jgi:hypothetical protein
MSSTAARRSSDGGEVRVFEHTGTERRINERLYRTKKFGVCTYIAEDRAGPDFRWQTNIGHKFGAAFTHHSASWHVEFGRRVTSANANTRVRWSVGGDRGVLVCASARARARLGLVDTSPSPVSKLSESAFFSLVSFVNRDVAKHPGHHSIDLTAPEGKRPLGGKVSLDMTNDLEHATSLSTPRVCL